jgi:hypothetical protein
MRCSDAKPIKQFFRTTGHYYKAALVPTNHGREKMHKPLRHIEDTVTSVVALLISAALRFFGMVVLVLMLALGF